MFPHPTHLLSVQHDFLGAPLTYGSFEELPRHNTKDLGPNLVAKMVVMVTSYQLGYNYSPPS